jgi:hypothetical protein
MSALNNKTPLCGVSNPDLGKINCQVGIKFHDVVWTHHLYDATSKGMYNLETIE